MMLAALRNIALGLTVTFAMQAQAAPIDIARSLQPLCDDITISFDDRRAALLAAGWQPVETKDTAPLVDQIAWARVVELLAAEQVAAGTEKETYSLVQTLTRRALVTDPAGKQEFGGFLTLATEPGVALYLAKLEASPLFQHYCSLIIEPPLEAEESLAPLFALFPAINSPVGKLWRFLMPYPVNNSRLAYSRSLAIPDASKAMIPNPAAVLRFQFELMVAR